MGKFLKQVIYNQGGFAIIIFALTIALLIGFGIYNIDLGADKRSKATTQNILQTKHKKELNRHLKLVSLAIKEKLVDGQESVVESDYKCSTNASINNSSDQVKRQLDNNKEVIFICKVGTDGEETGYLLSAHMNMNEKLQEEVSKLFIRKNQGAIGTAGRTVGTVTRVDKDSNSITLQKNGALFIGDTISTGPNSTATLEFKDDSTVVLGSSTSFKVDEFKFRTKEQRVGVFTATKGFIKAWIRKKASNQRVIFKTNTASLGVRGTVFSFNVAEVDAGTQKFVDEVVLEEGWLEIKDVGESKIIAELKMEYKDVSVVTMLDGYTDDEIVAAASDVDISTIPASENHAIIYYNKPTNKVSAVITQEPVYNASSTQQLVASNLTDKQQLATVAQVASEASMIVDVIKTRLDSDPTIDNPFFSVAQNVQQVASNEGSSKDGDPAVTVATADALFQSSLPGIDENPGDLYATADIMNPGGVLQAADSDIAVAQSPPKTGPQLPVMNPTQAADAFAFDMAGFAASIAAADGPKQVFQTASTTYASLPTPMARVRSASVAMKSADTLGEKTAVVKAVAKAAPNPFEACIAVGAAVTKSTGNPFLGAATGLAAAGSNIGNKLKFW